MEKLEVLKRSDLFRELSDEEIGVIAGICTTEEFSPGTTIHKQNTILDKLYVIEDGLVAIVLDMGPLSQRQIQAASNFETFGWSAVVPPHLTTATAKAVETTKVLVFKGQDILNFCKANPQIGCTIYRGVARVVADRLHAAFMQCAGVTAQD